MGNTTRFLTAIEVATILGISSSSAYRLIKKMNEELKKQGKIILPGKISRRYFEEKTTYKMLNMSCKRMDEDKNIPKWYYYFYYTNSQGEKVKKKKEIFFSKREAIEYENNFIFSVKFYALPTNPLKISESMGSKKTDGDVLFWKEDEFHIFIKQVEDKPMSKVLFNLLFYTGMKIGEVLALTLNDFNFKNNYININKTYKRIGREDIIKEPKTRKGKRNIIITPFLAKIVKEYSEKLYDYHPNERLLPVTNHYVSHEINRGIKGTKLKKIRICNFRHSHTALLMEMKIDIYEISERLGHYNFKTILDTYAHLYPNKKSEIAMKLEDRYTKERKKGNHD